MSQDSKIKVAIGPAPFNWGRNRLMNFYCNEIIDSGVDSVYIGNTICHKREVLSRYDFQIIVDALKEKEIKVYYSTLALSTTAEEFDWVKGVYDLFDGIEINMLGFLNLLKDKKLKGLNKEIVLGPYLNIYNWKSAAYLKKFNPQKLVAPFELPLESIADIAEKSSVPVEITAWGNLPTAVSWRCYTARAVNRTREDCGKACFKHPGGMLLNTVENEELFKIEGIQVESAKTHCIIEHLDRLQANGVSAIRLYPQLEHTPEIVGVFQRVLEGKQDARSGLEQLAPYAPCGFCNGWFLGNAGWEYVAA